MRSTEQLPENRFSEEIGERPETSPTYISVKDTAELLGVSRLTVYRRYHAGQFPGRKFGRSIDILAVFVRDLMAAIHSGQPVDVDRFAANWTARASEGVAS